MKRTISAAIAAGFVLSVAAAAAAQTPQAPASGEQFKPTVGQSGKDVVWVPTSPEPRSIT